MADLKTLLVKVVVIYAIFNVLLLIWIQTKACVTSIHTNTEPRHMGFNDSGNHQYNVIADQVVILTYHRSGSSFAGELFNQNNNAFYFFEPIWGYYTARKKYGVVTYSNGTTRRTKPIGLDTEETTLIADNFLNCKMSEIPLDILVPFQRILTQKGDQKYTYELHYFVTEDRHRLLYQAGYGNCIKRNRALGHRRCVPIVQKVCDNAQIKVIKTLRLRMFQLDDLLRKNPKLKVIHLVRDPRASLWSVRDVAELNADFYSAAHVRCGEMASDLHHRKRLEAKYGPRLMQLKYEDFADNPLEAASNIYNFLKHKLPKEVIKWVITDPVQNKVGAGIEKHYRTKKSNSSAIAHAWLKTVPPEVAFEIDQACRDVYSLFGYKPYLELRSASANLTSLQNHESYINHKPIASWKDIFIDGRLKKIQER